MPKLSKKTFAIPQLGHVWESELSILMPLCQCPKSQQVQSVECSNVVMFLRKIVLFLEYMQFATF
jgi:hypothetical protein